MAVVGVQVTVTTSATLLSSSTDTEGGYGYSILVTNVGAVVVTLGGSGVVAATGYFLQPGASLTLDGTSTVGDALYGITASGTCVVHVLRSGA